MKIKYELHDYGVEKLVAAIVGSAARKHRNLIKKRARKRKKDESLEEQLRDIERFFRSEWGQLLCGDNGDLIIRKDYDVAMEEIRQERKMKRG